MKSASFATPIIIEDTLNYNINKNKEMKRIIILIVAITLVACSKQKLSEQAPSKLNKQEIRHTVRSYDEALKIAENAIDMLESSKSSTRSKKKCRKIDFTQNKVIMSEPKTRAELDDCDSLIYVFNFENNEGFALVSASKSTEGLLAVTEKGHFDPNIPSKIKGFEEFKEMAKEYVRNAFSINRSPVGPIVETKDSITYTLTQVGPYLTVRWGQNYPEGELCPNGKSGCTNTAIAQLMSYYCYPTSINITYQGADVTTQTLNWADIKAHNTGHSSSNCSTLSTHNAIGRLLRQIGELNQSNYSNPDCTETEPYYIDQSLTTLGYNCGEWHLWSTLVGSLVRSQLNYGHLFIIIGQSPEDIEDGHSWVIDGYLSIEKLVREMARTSTSGWFFTGIEYTETTNYMHFNWGGYGNCNGFFAEGVYNSALAYSYDAGVSHTATLNYSSLVRVICAYR